MAENLHSGHRKRVRQEFLEHGIDENTPAHKIFELLLFYSIPRCDTNEMAHRLLNKFGSVSAVLDADIEDLVQVEGINESSAILIKMIVPLARIYKIEKEEKPAQFTNHNQVGAFLLNRYLGKTEEMLTMICLDDKGTLLSFDIIEKGDISSVGVPMRKIIQIVSRVNANVVILAHNHPSSLALPSNSDITITLMVKEALSHIQVKLLDHIIISNGDYVSMAISKDYAHIFK
ncbi:MAG: RadC family protein [Clostridia bacterium]|nr:RadC family protein [Clostridia bacterium]